MHLRAFARGAGAEVTGYAQPREVHEQAADHLGHDRGGLEHAVWRHISGRRRG
ncbi:hypothetical protein GCM10010406_35060 [Streptomyces thermolineatus]|uniref:Uncharacterized protein n=1 Tax=Streptomyces thermolineatus TaxID=44033 RepID=A0ABN3M762_9ACTN